MLAPDVLIIGAGPSGLAAATALKQAGIGDVLVTEREPVAGGIPRHCGHTGYGLREFHRLMSGADYAARLVTIATAAHVRIMTGTAVTAIRDGLAVTLAGVGGTAEIRPKRILIATGTREMPRSARLLGGTRPPHGVMSTGELQQRIYLNGERPFSRPVIIGAELVAFSALLTLRHAGIRPLALIAPPEGLAAPFGTDLAARLLFGLTIIRGHVRAIRGGSQVRDVQIDGHPDLACDGVIIAGHFVPETQLLTGRVRLEPLARAPEIDHRFRTSLPGLFATGNLLHPVETAGQCWQDGREAAAAILADIARRLPPRETLISVSAEAPIKQVWPQRLDSKGGKVSIGFAAPVSGRLVLIADGVRRHERKIRVRAEKTLRLTLTPSMISGARAIHFAIMDRA